MVQAGQRNLSEFLAHEIGKPEKFGSGFEARKASDRDMELFRSSRSRGLGKVISTWYQ